MLFSVKYFQTDGVPEEYDETLNNETLLLDFFNKLERKVQFTLTMAIDELNDLLNNMSANELYKLKRNINWITMVDRVKKEEVEALENLRKEFHYLKI